MGASLTGFHTVEQGKRGESQRRSGDRYLYGTSAASNQKSLAPAFVG